MFLIHGFHDELLELRYLGIANEVNGLQKYWEKLNVHDKHDF
jgi:hypothetical protein